MICDLPLSLLLQIVGFGGTDKFFAAVCASRDFSRLREATAQRPVETIAKCRAPVLRAFPASFFRAAYRVYARLDAITWPDLPNSPPRVLR